MEIKVYANFYKKRNITYRNCTELIFPSTEDEAGILLMLNPGKSMPLDKKVAITEKPIWLLCDPDNLMKSVTKWLFYFYKKIGKNLPHKVFIVNLSDQRVPDSKNLKTNDFTKETQEIGTEISKLIENNKINWLWAAYGRSQKIPSKLRIEIPILLKNFDEILIGKSVGFKHPSRKGDEYWQSLLAEFINHEKQRSQ